MSERKSVLLRLDPAVHDALARWAGDELRSTNAQIEFLLRRALADAGRLPGNAREMRRPGRPPSRSQLWPATYQGPEVKDVEPADFPLTSRWLPRAAAAAS